MDRRGLEPTKRVAYCEYDFSVDGGAVGDITLRGDTLPEGAIVTDGKIDVKTAFISTGSAIVGLKLATANDVLADTGKASFTLNAILDVVPVRTAATSIRIPSGGKQVVMTIGTAVLTAGKFVLALEYYA